MAKKNNNRAQKKALKKAQRKTNRNVNGKIAKKIEKQKCESLNYQVNQLLNNMKDGLTKAKAKINVDIAKIKYTLRKPFIERELKKEENLNSLISSFASREHISVALASIIILNCISASLNLNKNIQTENNETVEYTVEETQEPEESETLEPEESEIIESRAVNYEGTEDFEMFFSKTYNLDTYTSFMGTEEPVETPHIFTNEEKIAIIEDKYNITHQEFLEIAAFMQLEGGKNQYDECYNTTSALFNRICSPSCIAFVNNIMGPNTGVNIYNQLVCPGQFTVSRDAVSQLIASDMSIYPGYQAVIDMLYSSKPSHYYYRFVAPRLSYKYNCIPLAENGNYYFAEIDMNNIVDPSTTLPNYGKYMTDEYLAQTTEEEIVEEQSEKILKLQA